MEAAREAFDATTIDIPPITDSFNAALKMWESSQNAFICFNRAQLFADGVLLVYARIFIMIGELSHCDDALDINLVSIEDLCALEEIADTLKLIRL